MQKQTTALTSIIAVESSIHSVHLHKTILQTFLILLLIDTLRKRMAVAIMIFYKELISGLPVLLSLLRSELIIMRVRKIQWALFLPALQERDNVIMTIAAVY